MWSKCLRVKVTYQFLVVASCDLSRWVEANPLRSLCSRAIADFLWEDVIRCHGCFGKLVVDGGSEIKEAVKELAQRYGVKKVVMSAYPPQANEMIERGRKPIVGALLKMLDGELTYWMRNLPAVAWQIDQLYVPQPASPPSPSVVGVNTSSLSSLKSLPGQILL